MKETIIKGTGNSRSIKSVTTLPLTWEDARAQLVSSGWPVDIGAINAAGCQQVGDALNKANLLKDATAALYGLGATAVPDQVLASIYPILSLAEIKSNASGAVEYGSFTGTGIYVQELNFSIQPNVLFILSVMEQVSNNRRLGLLCAIRPETNAVDIRGKTNSNTYYGNCEVKEWTNSSVKLYADYVFTTGTKSTYLAIGSKQA